MHNITYILLAVTVATSLLALNNSALYNRLVLIPYNVVHRRQWYTVISSGFIHKDLMHLFFNMFTLYMFGPALQQWLGAGGFLLVYMRAMVLADIPTIAKHRDNPNYGSLGASGAISGVVFSFIMFSPFASLYLFFIPVPIPAIVFGLLYLVYSAYMAKQPGNLINHSAHFYGALAGVVLTILIKPEVLRLFIMQIRVITGG